MEFLPEARSLRARDDVVVRAVRSTDVGELSVVMSARGGTAEEHVDRARRLIGRLSVLSVAEMDDALVGWSGAQKAVIEVGGAPEWLIAGLTVVPAQRRRGIAARLLGDVVAKLRTWEPKSPVFSVINAQNPASVALHEGLGFREVARGVTFARIEFTGGEGVLLRYG